MKDGPGRRIVKRIALWNFYVNMAVHRAWMRLRRQNHYRLAGDCRSCARCCEAPAIQVGRLTWNLKILRRLFLAWHKGVNGFDRTDEDAATQTFTFRCTHFDWTTRRCDTYDSRPGMCRDYPRLLLEQPRPELLPGCGYRAVWRKAESLSRALEATHVKGEAMEKLRRDLYLE